MRSISYDHSSNVFEGVPVFIYGKVSRGRSDKVEYLQLFSWEYIQEVEIVAERSGILRRVWMAKLHSAALPNCARMQPWELPAIHLNSRSQATGYIESRCKLCAARRRSQGPIASDSGAGGRG